MNPFGMDEFCFKLAERDAQLAQVESQVVGIEPNWRSVHADD